MSSASWPQWRSETAPPHILVCACVCVCVCVCAYKWLYRPTHARTHTRAHARRCMDPSLRAKRATRNPFRRTEPYTIACPEITVVCACVRMCCSLCIARMNHFVLNHDTPKPGPAWLVWPRAIPSCAAMGSHLGGKFVVNTAVATGTGAAGCAAVRSDGHARAHTHTHTHTHTHL